jgi:hypothetical protein
MINDLNTILCNSITAELSSAVFMRSFAAQDDKAVWVIRCAQDDKGV